MRPILTTLVLACLTSSGIAQESTPLSVEPTIPRPVLHENYRYQLRAHGGIAPYHWERAGGELPDGMVLGEDGVLSGTPTSTGEFHFAVTLSDSAKPAHQINQELSTSVKAGLVAEWKQAPQLDVSRLHGSVGVSNDSDDDFDLTVIVLAVNETGKAFAAGYQHGTLAKDAGIEVPFDDTLPNGSYVVNVDVVAEVPPKNRIHRARLVTPPMKVPAE